MFIQPPSKAKSLAYTFGLPSLLSVTTPFLKGGSSGKTASKNSTSNFIKPAYKQLTQAEIDACLTKAKPFVIVPMQEY